MSFAVTAAVTAVASIGMGLYGASQQASAQEDAAKYQSEAGGRQRAQSEWEAKQIWVQGQEETRKVRSKAIQLRAQQVAGMAQSGIMIGDGSSQSLLDETTSLAEQDVMAVLYNAARGQQAKEEAGRLAERDALFQSNQLYKQASITMIGATGQAFGQISSLAGSAAARSGGGNTKASGGSGASGSFLSQSSGAITPSFKSGNY